MSKLIEKYIYDVTRRLKEEEREDVGNELRANILEMVEDESNEEEVKRALYSLGSPRQIANSYRNYKGLISPIWMGDYLYTLKIVLIILGSIGLVFGLIESLQSIESNMVFGTIFEVFFETIGNAFSSLLSGFAIVTLIFIAIDRYGEKKDDWKVEDLPEVPKKTDLSISRSGSIAGLIVTIIFGSIWLYILYYSNLYLGWFEVGGEWVVEESIFNLEYTRLFVLIFGVSLLVEAIVYAFKIKYAQWNYNLLIMYVISKVFSVVVAVVFLTGDLISVDFITRISTELSFTYDQVDNFINIFKSSIVGIIIVANIIDCSSLYFKKIKYLK